MKTNKDGWIRHRGGSMPKKALGRIEVKFRDGDLLVSSSMDWDWKHYGRASDIMAWRLHKSEETAMTPLETNYTNPPPVKFDPIALRDTIRKKEQEISDSLETVEKWRSEIQCMHEKLKTEGFALVDSTKVEEDISDPNNWRIGDIFISSGVYTFDGEEVQMLSKSGDIFECAITGNRQDAEEGFGYAHREHHLTFVRRP